VALQRNRRCNPEMPARRWPADREAPYVQVIVPARNEAANMPALLRSILGQDYPAGRRGMIVVDDGSADATAEAARHAATDFSAEGGTAAPVMVLAAPALPDGWTGKSNALWAGYTKTLFWASGHNMGRALVTTCALALYALVPVGSLAYALAARGYVDRREALLHAPLQIVPMLALRASISKHLGVPTVYAFSYPPAVAIGDAMLLYSAYRVASGRGVHWKGRTYRRQTWHFLRKTKAAVVSCGSSFRLVV
jgi:hypothetical protein